MVIANILMSNYCIPVPILSSSHVLAQLVIPATFFDRYGYYSYFTDEKVEAQKG